MIDLSTRDLRVLAATMDAEAGAEPDGGILAVLQVVMNRAGNPRKLWQAGAYPGTGAIEATCLARSPGHEYGQFSCWNGDRAAKLRKYFVNGDPDQGWVSEDVARKSRDLLRLYINGAVRAPSGIERCSHYVNPERASPAWGGRVGEGIALGRHTFLRPDQLTPPERGIRPVLPSPISASPRPRVKPETKAAGGGLIAGIVATLTAWWSSIQAAFWSIGVYPREALAWVKENVSAQQALAVAGVVLLAIVAWLAWKEWNIGQSSNLGSGGGGKPPADFSASGRTNRAGTPERRDGEVSTPVWRV